MMPDDRLLALAAAVCDRQPIDVGSLLDATPAEDRRVLSLLAAISDQLWTPEPDDEPAPASHWGRFELRALLGRGAFGEVYRAWDPHFEREVAVKLRHANLDSAATHGQLLAEGRLLAKIDHPGVARVYELGEHDGRFGLVMERVEGETLSSAVAHRGPFPPNAVAAFGVELAGALAGLHDAKIVHRDLKAQNVILRPDGRLVLVDFGIGVDLSKPSDDEVLVSGTPLYMAPELFDGARPTPASDLYSLGVLLFHLATGEFPIEAETVADLRAAHGRAEPLAIRQRLRRRHGLVRVIEQCLAPRPEARPAGAGPVARRLAPWTRQGVKVKAQRAAGMLALMVGGAGLAQPAVLDPLTALVLAGPKISATVFDELCERKITEAGIERSAGNLGKAAAISRPLRFCRSPYARGNFLAIQRRYDEAAEVFVAILDSHPKAPDPRRQLVHMLARLGSYPEAIQRAKALYADYPSANNAELLAMYESQSGDFSAALHTCDGAPEPTEPAEHGLIAWPRGVALLGLGRAEEALAVLGELIQSGGDDAVRQAAALHLASAHAAMGDPAEARRLLDLFSSRQAVFFRLRETLFGASLALSVGDRPYLLQQLRDLADLPAETAVLPELRSAGRLADRAGETALFERFASKLQAVQDDNFASLAQVANLQMQALRASRAGEHDRAMALLDEAQRLWWPDLELLLTRWQIADRQSDSAACRTLKTLVTERKGEFLWIGIPYEWQVLAERYELDCAPAGSRTRRAR